MAVEYIQHINIDKQKWNDCIANSINSLIYVQSFYLDSISANWDALVLNDYEAVMPLLWKKKWGIRYLYQPSFIPQQGIFFRQQLSDGLLQAFISKALASFKFADFTLNYLNTNTIFNKEVTVTAHTNFILPLHQSYENLYKNYHPNFTKSLRRISKFNLNYRPSLNYNAVLDMYRSLYLFKLASVTKKDMDGFKNICKKLAAENNLVTRQAYCSNNKLLAAVLLLKDERRLYNIISCITADGKKLEANYFLYNEIIKEFCCKNLILDFEGSDIKGVANFYKKFNPCNQPCIHVKQNKLNWFIKLFKK